ncbi:MAG: hypothetical protein Q4P72_01710 [Eubacteriales bacterium]|nr:hypothetical protein [Eubacteriales bacterium]
MKNNYLLFALILSFAIFSNPNASSVSAEENNAPVSDTTSATDTDADEDSEDSSEEKKEEKIFPKLEQKSELIEKLIKEGPSKEHYVSGQQSASAYRNEQLQIAFDLPQGFQLYSPKMLAFMMAADEKDLNMLPADLEVFPQYFEFIAQGLDGDPKLSLIVETEAISGITLEDYLDTFSKSLKYLGYQSLENSEKTKNIAGQNYRVISFKFTEQGKEYLQDYYVRKVNDLFVYFVSTYTEDKRDGKDALLASIKPYKDAGKLDENTLIKNPGRGLKLNSDNDLLADTDNPIFDPNTEVLDKADIENPEANTDIDETPEIRLNVTIDRNYINLPSTYINLAEQGFIFNPNESLKADDKVQANEPSLEIINLYNKKDLNFCLAASFFNDAKEALQPEYSKVWAIGIDASLNTTAYDPNLKTSEINPKDSEEALRKSAEELENTLIFPGNLKIGSTDLEVAAYFEKLEKNPNIQVKISKSDKSAPEAFTLYRASQKDGKFIGMVVYEKYGLMKVKMADYSLGADFITDEMSERFTAAMEED